MPSFDELLEATMPFTATQSKPTLRLAIDDDFRAKPPKPVNDSDEEGGTPSAEVIEVNRIWQFDQNAATPARFDDVRLWSRGMGMNYSHPVKVADRIAFDDLLITRADGSQLQLPLTPEFVVGRWAIGMGEIPPSDQGLWQLEAKHDLAVLVAFVYEDVDGSLMPMQRADIDALGDAFMPVAGLPPRFLDFVAGDDVTARVCVGSSRYLALISLSTFRERPDFAPGALVGFARFYPHLMFMSNVDIEAAEISIEIRRPKKAMTHGDPEMMEEIKTLLVTDSNRNNTTLVPGIPARTLAAPLPIPVTSNIYDYYLVDPDRALGRDAQLPSEVTLADSRTAERVLENCVEREGGEWESIAKVARQGMFDNVHLAPRMKLSFPELREDGQVETIDLDDIAMVFICVHDCVHVHVRWAAWAGADAGAAADASPALATKQYRGFDGTSPYARAGAPGVPENQTIFASFPRAGTLVYRAAATRPRAGEWQVFFHHGAGYAIGEWPSLVSNRLLHLLRDAVAKDDSIYTIYPSMPRSWASFYWRCRFTELPTAPGFPAERLAFSLQRATK
ncbi:MAG: hypothetical protein K1X88_20165 [Nannocystaceae bacterium]|nr:hypothetical protein [Nannocystaceae bacterium]